MNKSIKTTLFYCISLLIPVTLFVATEVGLRQTSLFEQQPLFVPVPNMAEYLQPNPQVVQRFFPTPEMTPKVSPDTQYFLAKKPEDSFRIVIQGGSTAAGFPFGRWGSLSGMMQQRFKRLYPEKHIEIINTAMASVNSYTLLDFNEEIQAIAPDLVVIYTGHNEYLGVMGVGSAFAAKGGRAATLMYLRVKNLRIFRLVEHLYYQYLASVPDNSASQRTLMAAIAKEKDIAIDSELYRAGVAQFDGNLGLILQAYREAGVPVMVGSLVSNEKDIVPFSGVAEFEPAVLTAWLEESASWRQQKQSALSMQPDALSQYLAGKLAQSLGSPDVALGYFQSARDLDLLRFRAPTEFNAVIKTQTQQYGATWVDVDNRVRQDTSDGIIGSKHMLEHLHPTERGYFLLADAFVQAFKQQKYITDVVNYPDDVKKAWAERPISKADALYGRYKIANLVNDYPFTTTPTKAEAPTDESLEANAVRERIAGQGWLDINHKLVPQYHSAQDFEQDALISGLLADALPNNRSWGYIAGLKYKQLNNLPLALYYLHKEVKQNPFNYAARLSLAQTYYFMARKEDSLKHLEFVKLNRPEQPNIDKMIARVKGS